MTAKNETPAFDFSGLDLTKAAETPFEFELLHPESDAPLGVFITVVGSESETFQTYMRREMNQVRKRQFEAQRKGSKGAPDTIEEDEERVIRAIAHCVKGWRTVSGDKSEPIIIWGADRLECTPDNAFRWLKHFRWVRPQVDKATGDISNFLSS